ncbi:MAG: ABC transporter ATP-binding protein/permease, partial [Gemmatimonadota bacterium]|nr:ABC transporter ATP-binding protein/permease [Gemmatimonadota bacterium]
TVFDARIRPELVVVYLTVALRMLSPVKRLAYAPAQLQHALASWTRVVEILDSKEDDTDDEDATKRPVDQPTRIVFDNVRFAYVDEEFVLDGVDLTIKRGEVLGVIGPSGEGKSTLLDLLPRFIDPAEGHVSVDGVPTTELSRKGLRRIIGYVGQETVVFHDTVSKNISYGEPLDREAVVVAAKAACAHEFIEQLPHGYDTVLGERGTLLSAGQRQRIALARVLLRNPPVLLLDEATSALDQETESRVYAGLKEFFEERIVVIVAHRPSSLSAAQNVAVLRSGKIVHFGPKTGRNESGFDAEPAEVSQSSAEESKSPVMKNDEREF